jgi:uncharacterized protein (TIGR00730 family)
MNQTKTVTVFCGAALGRDPIYEETAKALAREIAARKMRLVYGGGRVGLMGVLADTAISLGVHVTGVIPRHLMEREIGHTKLSQQIIVDSMHERKFKMAELADLFVALPGGFGTLDELFEILTWAQLGLHGKPAGILNVNGYFDSLKDWVDRSTNEGFVDAANRKRFVMSDNLKQLLSLLENAEVLPTRWGNPVALAP